MNLPESELEKYSERFFQVGDKVSVIGEGEGEVHTITLILPDFYTQQLDLGLFKLNNGKYYRKKEIKKITLK